MNGDHHAGFGKQNGQLVPHSAVKLGRQELVASFGVVIAILDEIVIGVVDNGQLRSANTSVGGDYLPIGLSGCSCTGHPSGIGQC